MARRDLKEDVLSRLNEAVSTDLFQRSGLSFKKKGRELVALCPFHDDNNPSLNVNPSKGNGVWKCFVCGAGGPDVVAFVQQMHHLSFPEALEHVAGMLGIDGAKSKDLGKASPDQREAIEPVSATEYMTSAEVSREYKKLRDESIDPAGPLETLGIDPRAAEIIGATVVERSGRRLLVVPMRNHEGDMCSLRFRCFETKRRWSLDEKAMVDGEMRQIKSTNSGLLAPLEYWDDQICTDGIRTVVIEGETDLLAAITMMIRHTDSVDPADWPARWVGLPGCSACHDMLCESPLSPVVQTFLDNDQAGFNAVFSVKRRRKDGSLGDRVTGLLEKIRSTGRQALAASPPIKDGGGKVDLRDLVRDGWGWSEFDDWSRRMGTADIHGRKFMRR